VDLRALEPWFPTLDHEHVAAKTVPSRGGPTVDQGEPVEQELLTSIVGLEAGGCDDVTRLDQPAVLEHELLLEAPGAARAVADVLAWLERVGPIDDELVVDREGLAVVVGTTEAARQVPRSATATTTAVTTTRRRDEPHRLGAPTAVPTVTTPGP
jgi:hypothetical protein